MRSMIRRPFLFALLFTTSLLLSGLTACSNKSKEFPEEHDMPPVSEIQKQVLHALKPGDPETTIITYLKATGWKFGWDALSKRYECLYPKENRDSIGQRSNISMYIYLNEDRSFKSAAISEVYTFL